MPTDPSSTPRLPVVFIPHGGGPWPFVELGLPKAEVQALAAWLRQVGQQLATRPKALLVISAHWERPVATVMTSAAPPLLYDYSGFPQEAYRITWPAPGSPSLAARVRELLSAAGLPSAEDSARGYDHGTFIPLKLMYPEADIPCVQLSLKQGLDPAEHLALGRALAPLRDEGVFIIGSGMTFHNLRAFGDPRAHEVSAKFDAWVQDAATAPASVRDEMLRLWTQAPYARLVHPREEHLLPLMVAAGAAGEDRGTTAWSGSMMGARLSGFRFG
ncbi:class III extradiol ring-cleavage dioxygenase [Corallococcus sp. AS-1-12]|uniref:DODA-type extradiol aromatic ring-opening family dioxygenase n=1 Tax=Corallococcus sp. AS-1-12 TaxID=2874598 RepID=UPI001CBAB9FC|nr:class III extradiol ring-cleavage dioxygenase [Corallococcus sp. AS-1-12]MBZ4336486.1 dioxygenase [Corallococcus sp. AS-1-12]